MNLLDSTPAVARRAIEAWLQSNGQPRYRVSQILPRLWHRPVARWEDATDLPRELRARLDIDFPLPRPTLRTHQRSRDGTEKFLWGLGSGGAVESVLIPEGRRTTLCISSQEGCAFGCAFCATGRMGFIRQLHAWEIVAQVRELCIDNSRRRPTNVVFMGMGEPLHNWPAVDVALTILNDADGVGIGARHITVSTVGIVPILAKLAARTEQFRLALSLHAPRSDLRRRLMPVEKKYPLPTVIAALAPFPRRVTFEYVLIDGVNDGDTEAEELAALARPLGALINLLPLHPGGAPGFTPTPPDRISAFVRVLESRHAAVTVRKSRGLDISAACGQLRTETLPPHGVAPEPDGHIEQ